MHLGPPRGGHKPSWCPCIQETPLAPLHYLGDVQSHMWLTSPPLSSRDDHSTMLSKCLENSTILKKGVPYTAQQV